MLGLGCSEDDVRAIFAGNAAALLRLALPSGGGDVVIKFGAPPGGVP